MTLNNNETYILNETNIEEITKKINDFCKNGFNHTHDWLEYTGMTSKGFDQLTFEKDYPTYNYQKEAKWIKKEDNSMIWLNSIQDKWVVHTITMGTVIIFLITLSITLKK
ncbi:hypothetical protein DA469_21290 [Bacillus subtilis]|nr:hypothetical protein DA469_21290 [Bacillus subtilis]